MPNTDITPNFQMIHIASELVALAGLTFYFTSKCNALSTDIKKLQQIVQAQQKSISNHEKNMKELAASIAMIQTSLEQKQSPEKFDQMFNDPTDVIAQMMQEAPQMMQQHTFHDPSSNSRRRSGSSHDISSINDQSQNHSNIQVINDSDDDDDDDDETESQLDLQLSDEFAELATTTPKPSVLSHKSASSSLKNKHEKIEKIQLKMERPIPVNDDLNDRPPSNNSELSINDT